MTQRRRRSVATASAFSELGVENARQNDGRTRSSPRNSRRRDPPNLPSRRPRPSPRDSGRRDPPSLTPCWPHHSTSNSSRRDPPGLHLRHSRLSSNGLPRESPPAAKRDKKSSPSKPSATHTARNDKSTNPSLFRRSLPPFTVPKHTAASGSRRAKSASPITIPHAVTKNSSETRSLPYRVGQTLRDPGHALPFASSSQASGILAVLPMKTPLFVKRTSREWTYATLISRAKGVDGEMSIVVRVDAITKSKKVLQQREWHMFLRMVNNRDGLDKNKMDQRNDLATVVVRDVGSSFVSAANGGGNGDAVATLQKISKPGPGSGGNTISANSHSSQTAHADADCFGSAWGNQEFGHGRSDKFLPPPTSRSLSASPSRHQLIADGDPRQPALPLPRSTSLSALQSRHQLMVTPQRLGGQDHWAVPVEISKMVRRFHDSLSCSSTCSSWSMTSSSNSSSSSSSCSSDSSSGSSHSSFGSSSSISL